MQTLEDRIALSNYLPTSHYFYNQTQTVTTGSPIEIASAYLAEHAASYNITAADLQNALVTDQYTDIGTGTTHIYLRQMVNGLEVNNANINISIASSGRVIGAGGSFIGGLQVRLAGQSLTPNLTPSQAVLQAAEGLQITVTDLPTLLQSPVGHNSYSIISAPQVSLDDIEAKLHYVPVEGGGAELSWQMVLRTPHGSECCCNICVSNWYDLSVSDSTGEIVAKANWANNEFVRGNVLPLPNDNPFDGGFAVVMNPADPIASPFGWHDTNGVAGAEFTDTRGNNVLTGLDRNDNDVQDADEAGLARPDGGVGLDFSGFNYNLTQAPTAPGNADFAQLNLFYVNNMVHDISYKFGFTEAAGNFQTNNYGRGGLGNDAVRADAQDGFDAGSRNNANFATPPDGIAPRMQQFVFDFGGSNPLRDSDIDNGIIIHEYTHGISNRLTGGPANASALTALQSRGMGEGWSDYVGLILTLREGDSPSTPIPLGLYSFNDQPLFSGFAAGVRHFPYSFDMSVNPLTFADYGSGGPFGGFPSTRIHDAGEIWCSALFDMTWLLINKFGYDADLSTGYTGEPGPGSAGNKLALRLVLDGMKLQPANPTFIQARDAILAADMDLTGGANRFQILTAFGRRGLGLGASTPGANSDIVIPDTTVPVVEFAVSATNLQVVEGAAGTVSLTVTVVVNPASDQVTTVDFATVDATATLTDNDYVFTSGTLTFAPGETSKSFNVFVNGDGFLEGDETFRIVLSSPTNATIAVGGDTTIIVIRNDDPSLSIAPMVTVTEPDTGTTTASFDVTLSAPSVQTVTVDYITQNGTATTADGDFVAQTGMLVFLPGQLTQTITVVVNGDTKFENDENFTVNLFNSANAFIRDAIATGAILNEDPLPTLALSGPTTFTEGNSGTTLATYTVTLFDPDGSTVTLNYATSSGSATAGDDYATTSGTLTFAPGETTKTFTVAVNGDNRFELDEDFSVVISSASVGMITTDTVNTTITNDEATPSFSVDSVSVLEGDTGTTSVTFTVTLSGPSDLPTAVDFTTVDGSATSNDDFLAQSGTLNFAAGVTSRTVTIVVNNDITNEGDESFTFVLSNPTVATLGVDTGTGTIVDDDPTLLLSQPVLVTEGNSGSINAVFTVTLSVASTLTATVNFTTMNGSALAGEDYTATTGTLTFEPGIVSQTFSVPILGDLRNEVPESYTVVLSGAVNAIIGGTGTIVGSIADNDPQPFVAVANALTTSEGAGTVSFPLTLSQASGRTVTIDFVTFDSSATTADGDYTAQTGTVTFAPGETSKMVTIAITGDTRDELNETFGLRLSNPTNSALGASQATATITDDDAVPDIVITGPGSILETDGGSNTVLFTVTLSTISGRPISVNFSTFDGTALRLDNDYLSTTGTLNFAPGETTKTISVPINGDTRSEGSESFSVSLTSAVNSAIAQGTAIATITDNDSPPLVLVSNTGVTEGDGGNVIATFAVSLSAVSGQPVTVNFATRDGLAIAGRDYVPTSGSVTFAPGEVSKSFSVPVIGDAIDEMEESFQVVLSNAVGAIIAVGTGTAIIADDEEGQIVIAPGDGTRPVILLDSQTGATREIPAPFPGFGGEIRTARGDINGDGAVDVIFASGPGSTPHIKVISGEDGSTMASFFAYRVSFTGGVQLAVGDVNGDGRMDIITGASAGGGPHVQVFSGVDFTAIQSFFAYAPEFTLGVTVAAGDVNGDGFADIITGAGAGGSPHVKVFSGRNLSELASFFAFGERFTGGVAVAAGDLDGDGRDDLIIAAGVNGTSHVRGVDALNQRELASFFAYNPRYLGSVQVATTDADGDGLFEIVTAAGRGGTPHLKRFSAGGVELDSRFVGDPNFLGGIFVA